MEGIHTVCGTLSTSTLLLLLAIPVPDQSESAERYAADNTGLVPEGFPSLETIFGFGATAVITAAGPLGADDDFLDERAPFVEFVGLIVGDPRNIAFLPLLPLGVPVR